MQKDDVFWLRVSYFVFGACVWYVVSKAIELVGVQTGWGERYDSWYVYMQLGVGAVAAIISTIVLKSSPERHEYYLASIAELRKVTWPSWPDVKKMTIVVCAVVGIFAVILGVFDVAWSKILSFAIGGLT